MLEPSDSRLRRLEHEVAALRAQVEQYRAREAHGATSGAPLVLVELLAQLERGGLAEARLLAAKNGEWLDAGVPAVVVSDAQEAVGPLPSGLKLLCWREPGARQYVAIFRCP